MEKAERVFERGATMLMQEATYLGSEMLRFRIGFRVASSNRLQVLN